MSGNLRLYGATSGYSQISAPDVAGDQIFVVPSLGGEVIVSGNNQSLDLGTGNLTATTVNAGNIILPDSGGITFGTSYGGSGTGVSKVLDDYEEGTFTPVFRGDATPGTYSGTFNGFYTKIGNRVMVEIQMSNITAVSAGSGGVEIAGMPFASSAEGAGATGAIRYDSWNVNDVADGLVPLMSNNSDFLQIFEVGDDRGDSGTNVGDITSGATDIFISIVYRV